MKRSDFFEHVAWTGAGIAYTLGPGSLLLTGRALAGVGAQRVAFVQISDSHIGFHQPANPDMKLTLQMAVDAINAMPAQPAFVVHTGDQAHLLDAAAVG